MATHYMFPDGLPGTSAVYNESPSIEVGNVFHLNQDLSGWTMTGARVWVDPSLVSTLPANIDIYGVYGNDITTHAQTKRRAVVAGWNTVTFDTPLAISPIKLPFSVSYKFVEDPTAYMSFSPSPTGEIVCPTNSRMVMDVPGLAVRSLYRIGTGAAVQNTAGNLYGVDVIVNAPNTAPTVTVAVDQNQQRVGDSAHLSATAADDGSIASYAWSIAGPSTSTSQLSSTSSATPTFVPSAVGDYTLTCLVTDNDGSTATASVAVHCIVPSQLVVTLPGQALPTRNVAYQLTAGTSNGFGGKSYTWSIVSSPSGVTGTFSNTHIANPTFTATDIGNFVLRCSVTDQLYSASATMNVAVQFEPPAPATYFRYNGFVWVPQAVVYL